MASPGNIPSQKTTKETIEDIRRIKRMTPALREMFPNFDKLSRKQQDRASVLKSLQKALPDDPTYSDKAIKAEILGLATKDYDVVGEDDLGRIQFREKVNKKAPAGYKRGGRVKMKHGGKACRGRKANYKA
jgi:hypothetical protein